MGKWGGGRGGLRNTYGNGSLLLFEKNVLLTSPSFEQISFCQKTRTQISHPPDR